MKFPGDSRSSIICAILFLGTLLMFSGALKNDFLDYDDPDYVTQNVHVQHGLHAETVRWAFASTTAGNWHPLTWLSHAADWQLFSRNSLGHHATNILLHALNAVLAFLALRKLTGSVWTSALCAALFAWHPLRVESVAWVAERKDLLCGFFFFLALWTYASYAKTLNALSAKSKLPYTLTLCFFACGIMSKPMIVTLPLLLLLLDFWPLRRFENSSLKRLLGEKIPFFVLSATSCALTFLAQKESGAVVENLSFQSRLVNAAVSVTAYIEKFFWPFNLSVVYPLPPSWPVITVALAVISIFIFTALACLQIHRRPWLFVGWFWFVGMLVPVLGFLQVGLQAMADRYTYLPILGLQVALLWTLREFLLRRNIYRPAIAATILILAGFAVLTSNQIRFWQNSEKLYEHALAVTKNNYLAESNLATTLFNQGNLVGAESHFRRAITLKPDFATARFKLAVTLETSDRPEEALAAYNEFLKLRPRDPFARDHAAALSQNQPIAPEPRVIEAWGWMLAQDEKVAGIEISSNELSLFLKGFLAGARNQALPYKTAIFPEMEQLAKVRREKVTHAVIQRNLTQANAFLTELKQNTNVIALPENVFYEPLKTGHGLSPQPTQSVTIRYTAHLLDGTEFYQAGPIDMVLVRNRSVCRGWIPALEKLKRGGLAKLYVPPPLDEEEAERWGIEPGAMMVFEIELLGVKETSPEDLANAMIPLPPDSAPEKSGYNTEQMIETWGWNTARRAGLNQLDLGENEISPLVKGLAAAMTGEKTPEDLEKNCREAEAFVAARREEKRAEARRKQSTEMEMFFSDLKAKTNVVELPDGLRYEISRPGDGTFPKDGQTVLVNYVGHLIDGSVFDKTMDEPLRIKVGSVIRGWNEGIQKVSKGGKINLYIPPSLAYGQESVAGIPSGSALIFEVELVDIVAN